MLKTIFFGIRGFARCGYRLKVRGAENIPKQGPCLLVSNHVSFIDWVLIGAAIPRPIRFVTDQSSVRGIISREFLKHADVIIIASQKENPMLFEKAFQTVAQALRDGEVVCMFPEGKLTLDGKINPFRRGIERMLQETPVPAFPVLIKGMWGSVYSKKYGKPFARLPEKFRPPVEVLIGNSIPASQATAQALFEKVSELAGSTSL